MWGTKKTQNSAHTPDNHPYEIYDLWRPLLVVPGGGLCFLASLFLIRPDHLQLDLELLERRTVQLAPG